MWSPNTLIDGLYQLLKSKVFTDLVHHGMLVFHERMHVSFQGDGRILVSEYLREGFHVHSAFYGTSCKGMAQGVKTAPFYPQFPLQKLKTPLI